MYKVNKALFVVLVAFLLAAGLRIVSWADDGPAPSSSSSGVNTEKKTEQLESTADTKNAHEPKASESKSDKGADGTKKDEEPKAEEAGKPYAEEAIKHYNRGVELHQSGFLNQAIAEYKAAIESDSRMEEAWSNLGLIYAAQRSYTKAIEAFNKALALKPGRPTTLNGLGTVLYARGRVEEAIAKWKQAIASDPRFASAYYNMGNALENEKDQTGALESYWQAIRLSPGMSDAYYRMGTMLLKDKHVAQASILLAKAVALSPEAEFVRDAKRQLTGLESQFAKEEKEEPEVQMNLMPPLGSSDGPEKTPSPEAGNVPVTKDGAKKSKPGSAVDMFLQPSQSPPSEK